MRDTLRKAITRPLTRNQARALTELEYDLTDRQVTGPEPALESSELVRRINAGHMQVAVAEIGKWCIVKGRPNALAVERRRANQQLFLKE